jgi:hypothetical protein
MKVYFAGDTAYRTVEEGEDEDKVSVCPAKEVARMSLDIAHKA